MRACVYTEYGPPEVLHVEEVAKPAPKPDEALIRVRATSVNFGDLVARDFAAVTPRSFNMPLLFWLVARLAFGVRRPRLHVLGSEFAGEVEAVGERVTRLRVGDRVFGYLGETMGAYAQYVCARESSAVAVMPARVSFDEAATIPYGAVMAHGLLRRVELRPGARVLVYGASGGIGAAAVQIARHRGAEVTGVCGAPRMAFVRSLGAQAVFDYRVDDVTQRGETYDVILDVLGRLRFSTCARALTPHGVLLCASFKRRQLLEMAWTALVGGRRVVCAIAPGGLDDMLAVRDLVEAGAITATTSQRFTLEQTADAHRYVASARREGPVVIAVA